MDPRDVATALDSHHDVVHLVLPVGAPMAQLIRAQTTFLDLLREVSRAVAGTIDDPVTWIVERVSESSADLHIAPKADGKTLPDGSLHRMTEAVPAGIEILARGAERPHYFTDRALALTTTLTTTLPNIHVRNGGSLIEITRAAGTHAQTILDQPYLTEIGTVEGRLEIFNIHNRRQFVIFDELTAARIECQFGHRIALDDVLRGGGRRVAVTGEIRARESGEIISVLATHIEVFPPDDELASADDVFGILAG
jgi:hypothetical protein